MSEEKLPKREVPELPTEVSIYILREIIKNAEEQIARSEKEIAEVLPLLEQYAGTEGYAYGFVEVSRWKDHKCMEWK